MENKNFQTSFIPKKPLSEESRPKPSKKGMSLVTMVALFVFIVSVIAGIGVVLYKSTLANQVSQKEAVLEDARESFDPALIERLQQLDRRLKVAESLLNQHTMVSPLFDVLEAVTMKSVRFSTINLSFDDESKGGVSVTMSGEARSYTSIALQSDLLASSRHILDPIFTDLNLDQSGNVLFNLTYSVDPDLLSYRSYFTRMQEDMQVQTQVQEEVQPTEDQEQGDDSTNDEVTDGEEPVEEGSETTQQ